MIESLKNIFANWREKSKAQAEELSAIHELHAKCIKIILDHGVQREVRGIHYKNLVLEGLTLSIVVDLEGILETTQPDPALQYESLQIVLQLQGESTASDYIHSNVDPFNDLIHRYEERIEGNTYMYIGEPEVYHPDNLNAIKKYHGFLEQSVLPRLAEYENTKLE